MNGAVNFLKPPGMTSSDAVVWLRWALGTKKCGHGGTLDPAACGVLPVLVGSGTRLFDRMLAHQKTYAASITFGTSTDTLDGQGRVTERCDTIPTDAALRAVLPRFTGEIEQIPPKYSAIRVGGVHAYDAARRGEDFTVPARRVTIYSLSEPVWQSEKTATFRVTCSSGAYIRSLAADLAKACGTCAYLSALTREKSGVFSIEDALTCEDVLRLKEAGQIEKALTPMRKLLEDLPTGTVDESVETRAKNGAPIEMEKTSLKDASPTGEVCLMTGDGMLLGIYRAKGDGMFTVETMLLSR